MSDPINHPEHYTQGEIECIDAIRAALTPEEFQGFCKGNVFKYVWRSNLKNKPEEDLQKSEWYMQKLLEHLASQYRPESGNKSSTYGSVAVGA
jgi:hypothetical protein